MILLGEIRIPMLGMLFFGNLVVSILGIIGGISAAWRGALSIIMRGLRNASR